MKMRLYSIHFYIGILAVFYSQYATAQLTAGSTTRVFQTANPKNPDQNWRAPDEVSWLNLTKLIDLNASTSGIRHGGIYADGFGPGGLVSVGVYLYDPYQANGKGQCIYSCNSSRNSNSATDYVEDGSLIRRRNSDPLGSLTATDIDERDIIQRLQDNSMVVDETCTRIVPAGTKINGIKTATFGLRILKDCGTTALSAGAIAGAVSEGVLAIPAAIFGCIGGGIYSFFSTPTPTLSEPVETVENYNCQKMLTPLRQVIIELTVVNATVKGIKIPVLGTVALDNFYNPDVNGVIAIKQIFMNPLKYPNYSIVAAHRGYWKDAPENSYASYDAAIEVGADMVELDTRLTSDKVLVAFHDICLDRLTNGSGIFINHTWAEIQNLFLKDKAGNITAYHPVSIEQALTYMKGKALINLDLKDRGENDNLLKYAFKEAIKIAYRTGTLSQLILKGKLRLTDLQTQLDEVSSELSITPALTPKDINYNPVAFGWDTKNVKSFVGDYIGNQAVLGIELTYKTAYDPILDFVPKAINKGLRVGNYTFWPEECPGVISEDNYWTQGSCEVYYRQYAYQGDKDRGVPNSGAVLGSGEPGSTDNVTGSPDGGTTGGGSSGSPVNNRPAIKAIKPASALDDGRGDWDWFFKYGANFAITDRPALMIDYLTAAGKRDKRIPIITEVSTSTISVSLVSKKQPITIDIDGDEEGTTPVIGKKIEELKGFIRRISDYRKVDFFTPDTRTTEINCKLLPSRSSSGTITVGSGSNTAVISVTSLTNGNYREDCELRKSTGQPCNCTTIYGTAAEASIRKFPLHTLPEWSNIYPNYDIYINGNWFDVKVPTPLNSPQDRKSVPQAMYRMPCTDVFGYWQANGNSTPLSRVEEPDPDHTNLDALVLTKAGTLTLVASTSTSSYSSLASMAIGGYILAEGGVKKSPMPIGSSTTPKKKSALGINGYEVFVLSIQNQLLPDDLADYMIQTLGCKEVFMFDGGGSATMLSTIGRFPNPVGLENVDPVNEEITAGTFPEDKDPRGLRGFRPVPNFLGIKAKPQ